MTTLEFASLQNFADVFRSSGYAVDFGHFEAAEPVLLAESPYALVCCFEASEWGDLLQRVSDVQAELTQLAARAPSPRRWDLYVVVHMLTRAPGPAQEALAEAIEADTRYTRKFIRMTIPRDDLKPLETALRPLLPLRPAAVFDLIEPVEALRRELYDLDVPHGVADVALAAFVQDDEVEVP